jgi:hypothetical protein
MSKTATIRLTEELAVWLEQASKQSGVLKTAGGPKAVTFLLEIGGA